MQTTTLSFSNLHNYGELFANLFRARKQSFIVQKKWELPEAEDMEFDQYDTPQSRWIAIHDNGLVLAGIRLTPTTARCGVYSYMIRDAQRGLLGGSIPKICCMRMRPSMSRRGSALVSLSAMTFRRCIVARCISKWSRR